jgi:hypothetical protein
MQLILSEALLAVIVATTAQVGEASDFGQIRSHQNVPCPHNPRCELSSSL